MRNRFLSGWRRYVLFAVVASFALTPVFAGARDRVQTTTGTSTQGLALQATGDEASKQYTRYARSNYMWPFSSGPVYSTVDGRAALQPGVLHTQVGALRLSDLQGRLPAELQTVDMLDQIGAQYFILQVSQDALNRGGRRVIEEQINALGGEVVFGMPVNFLAVRLQSGTLADVRAIADVEAVVPYQAAFKINPMVGRRPLVDPVKAVSEVLDVEIALFRGETSSAVLPQIVALGAKIDAVSPDVIYASIHRNKLGQVANIQAVESIRERLPLLPAGEETTMTMQVGGFGAFGFARNDTPPYHAAGINGSGNGVPGTSPQVLLVIDSGAQLDAADLSDTHTLAGTAGPTHRKVISYEPATNFGGDGDFSGCDDPALGGGTHGHVVAATALGNATNIVNTTTGHAGGVVLNEDITNDAWHVDGVAPGAVLALMDANSTPAAGTCDDPTVAGITTGPFYFVPTNPAGGACPDESTCPGFLQWFYFYHGAKLSNMSFGSANNYDSSTFQIDNFLFQKGDALVFAAAGNAGQDTTPNDGEDDFGSVISPSTNKNGLSIGGSFTGTAGDGAENRYGVSSIGPADVGVGVDWYNPASGVVADPQASKDRIQPVLVAPSTDFGGGLGLVSEYVCRSDDNDITGAVECDRNEGNSGTSFGSPSAAGAGLLVRDYFAQGFYPSGAQDSGDAVSNISGAALKAILVASADFLNGGGAPRTNRFNNEQGYGRIQLDNVLPLQTWPSSPSGLLVHDGGIPGGVQRINGLNAEIDGDTGGTTDTATFQVVNADEELRIVLVWMDVAISSSDGSLATDLNLEVCAPANPACSGKVYSGNYFTDDDNRDKIIDTATEDCPNEEGLSGSITTGQWSIPNCLRADGSPSVKDHANNTEAVFLTNDLDGDNNLTVNPDPDPSDDTQVVAGEWTIRVSTDPTVGANAVPLQPYAVVVAGGALLEASVQFDQGSYACNDDVTVSINETAALAGGVVSGQTMIEVLRNGGVIDTETGLALDEDPVAGTTRHVFSPIQLSSYTAPEDLNGVLDVRDGDVVRVTYNSAGDGTKISQAAVNCKMRITAGAVTFGQFGYDRPVAVQGGCERNARGLFEFGFPDRYPDADEQIILSYAFASREAATIQQLNADLRCVLADDSLAPEECRSGSDPTMSCPNPDRLVDCDPNTCLNGAADNMTACPNTLLTITNPNLVLQSLPGNTAIGLNYGLLMGTDANIPDLEEVEFVLELSAPTAGLSGVSRAVVRQVLDADEIAVFYSTDYPTGGLTTADINNNEFLEGCEETAGATPTPCTLTNDPTRRQDDFTRDYRFETRSFSDLTDGGTNMVNTNAAMQMPWNFDTNDGGMRNGVAAPTDFLAITDIIAQWGEDTNFNNLLDGVCYTRYCEGDKTLGCGLDAHCGADGPCVPALSPLGYCGGNPAAEPCTQFDDPGDNNLVAEDCETSAFGTNCIYQSCNTNANCNGYFIVNPAPNNFLPRCRSDIEDIDPVSNGMLENVWNTDGGCGWQTAVVGQCTDDSTPCYTDGDCPSSFTCPDPGDVGGVTPLRGMWHTGRIGRTHDPDCLGAGNDIDQCQAIETVSGETGERLWFELLVTPELNKVSSDPDTQVNIEIFAWNQLMDLEDSNAATTWEIDGDLDSIEPADLTSDGTLMGIAFGGFTPRGGTDGTAQNNPDLTNGYSMFAPVFGSNYVSVNGTVGTNRHGRNACYFQAIPGVSTGLTTSSINELGLAGPLDDDENNGYCPGVRLTPCIAKCIGGSEDGEDCSVGFPSETVCTSGGGVCSDDDATINDCDTSLTCNGGQCEDGNGNQTGSGCTVNADCYTCTFDNAMVDEYVFPNGPIRNMDPTAFNGPDLRFTTVEDVQGETKTRFKAAIGMLNFEKPAGNNIPDPVASYGLGVDDFLIEWREISLVADATDCNGIGGGQCASVDTAAGTAFDGNTTLTVTVLDNSRGSGSDCNFDDDDTDIGACDVTGAICTDFGDCDGGAGDTSCDADPIYADDTDCDNDGIMDVPITVSSENEQPGERYFLPCANPQPGPTCPDGEYRGDVPVSSTYALDGVVFVQGQGAQNPVVEIKYVDWDDGTGVPCENNIDPLFNGIVQAFTPIALQIGNVNVTRLWLTDNGDNDAWADTNEVIDMQITVRNNLRIKLNNVVARLATNDPNVDCITNPIINLGSIEADDFSTLAVDEGAKRSSEAFTFRIADVDRQGTCSLTTAMACQADGDCPATETCDAYLQNLDASFTIFLDADEFNSTLQVQRATLTLDIDGVGGGAPTELAESFDTGVNNSFGIFGIANIDSFLASTGGTAEIPGLGGHGASLANSNDYRCSFADPDDSNSFTFNDPQCYMGIDQTHANDIWWRITSDRAYDGTQSLVYNTPAGGNIGWTTPTGVMEAVQMLDPVSLGYKNVCINDPMTQCTIGFCSITTATSCSNDGDCPATETCDTGVSDCPGGLADSCIPAFPRAVWKHQVSLMDYRTVNASSAIRSADGGVVHLQLADASDNPVGDWIKVDTVANQYDSQREDNYNVCSFDPVDDGNDEDTGFGGPNNPVITDPNDPDYDPFAFRDGAGRKISSSSTCFPEFSYTWMGDTDSAFNPLNAGNATALPGLPGSDSAADGSPLGTWVESVVDLSRFRGQNARVRMLVSSLKINTTWQAAFNFSISRPGDDGWWIDDFRLRDLIDSPATLVADPKPNVNGCAVGGAACATDADCGANGPCLFPLCGADCNTMVAQLDADPAGALATPGQVVDLSAAASAADRCADGVLQYRFWIDGGTPGDALEDSVDNTLVRNWSETADLLVAPLATTDYAADVRCSSVPAPTCVDTAYRTVVVNCPTGPTPLDVTLLGSKVTPGPGTSNGEFSFAGPIDFDFAEGDLATLDGTYPTLTTGGPVNGSSHTVGGAFSESRWVLIRKAGGGVECNSGSTWGSAARDANLP